MKFLRFFDVPGAPEQSDQASDKRSSREKTEKSARVGGWDGNDPSPGSFFLSLFFLLISLGC